MYHARRANVTSGEIQVPTTQRTIDSPVPVAREIAKEGESRAFLPYPDLGENLAKVPIHVRPDVAYYIQRMGFLPNAIKLYLHVPWIAEHLFNINNAIMRDERNSLSEHFKYRLSFLASRENGCAYCTAHHAATLKRRWNYSEKLLADVLGNDEPADEREAVAFEFVREASRNPGGVSDDLRSRLAKHFTPQEVMEIVLVVGFWKMYNLMHDAMKLPIEDPVIRDRCWVEYTPEK
jgi:AhpD family alkylhydroperoxidase